MASQKVVKRIVGNQTNKLKELGVEDVVMPLEFVVLHSFLVEDFKKNGIRIWVYNLKASSREGEKYFIDYGSNYIYGIYSDYKWLLE